MLIQPVWTDLLMVHKQCPSAGKPSQGKTNESGKGELDARAATVGLVHIGWSRSKFSLY